MTPLATFLSTKQIDVETLTRASARLESLTTHDRKLAQARRKHRGSGDKVAYDQAGIDKPRSGRPLRDIVIRGAIEGKATTRAQRAKLLRAINATLTRRGDQPVDAQALFSGDKS